MFRPLHNRVLVERLDAEAKTASGIIIPDSAKEKPQEGKVVAVGPGLKNKLGAVIPMDVKPGDRILFAKYGGSDIKIDSKDYLILKEEDVMAVVK